MRKYWSKSRSFEELNKLTDAVDDEKGSNSPIKEDQSMKSFGVDKEYATMAAVQSLRIQFPDISDKEEIINDYYCALRKSFLTHGRLYIGLEAFYFVSHFHKSKNKYSQKWSDVILVEKKNLMNIVPNCIRIITTESSFTFTSFVARSYPFQVIRHTIKNYERKLSLSPRQINEKAKNTCANRFKDKFHTDHIPSSEKIVNMGCHIFIDSISTNDSSILQESPREHLVDFRHTSHIADQESIFGSCSCKNLKHELTNQTYDVDIDDIFHVMYDEDSNMMKNVNKKLNFRDYKCISTDVLDDGSILKVSSAEFPCSIEGLTGKTKIYQVFPINNIPNHHYQVVTIIESESLQFGDSFKLLSRICMHRCGNNQTSYRVWMETRYTNPEWDVQKECVYVNNLQTFIKYNDEIANQLSLIFGSPVLIEYHEDLQVAIPRLVHSRQSWFAKNWHMLVHLILLGLLFSVFYQIHIQQKMIYDINSQLSACPDD